MKRLPFLRRICGALTAGALSLTMLPMQAGAADVWDGDVLTIYDDLLAGDVNGDGDVTVIDLMVYQGWLLMHDNVTMYAPWNADINADGDIDVFDLALAKRIVLGNGTAIPIKPDEPSEPETPDTPAEGGSIYQMIELTDPMIGVIAYKGILPEGWTVELASNWSNVSVYPGQEFITFTSPDGKATVKIASAQAYAQSNMHDTGVDYSDYTTYLPYMNAEQFIDYYVQNTYPGAEQIKAIDIPEEQTKAIQEIAESDLETFVQGVNALAAAYGYEVSPVGAEGTIARQQYKDGDHYGEYSCMVDAFQYSNQILNFTIQRINWTVFNSATYDAQDQEAFDKYYADYEMITANGYFTAAFYSANAYVANKIANMILDARNAANAEAAASSYADSGTEITSDDMSAQDRVFQAWDDYIRDEDRYTTTDGNQVTTSMFNETVAQDGDRFYVGSRTGIPDGFTELTKVTPLTP